MRLPDRSSGSASPRFSRHRRSKAASSPPMMIRASEPPIKERREFSVVQLTECHDAVLPSSVASCLRSMSAAVILVKTAIDSLC